MVADRVECPLCRRHRRVSGYRPLYGVPVCGRCRHAFTAQRQLAFVIDWVLWHAASLVFGAAVLASLIAGGVPDVASDAFVLLWVYGLSPVLFFCKDGFAGYSPGKALCGIRVVAEGTDRPIGFHASLKRNLLLWIPMMPVVLAFALAPGRRPGDGWARTRVVWRRHADHPLFAGRDGCPRCGYDLTGNTSGMCPECGAATGRPARPAPAVAA